MRTRMQEIPFHNIGLADLRLSQYSGLLPQTSGENSAPNGEITEAPLVVHIIHRLAVGGMENGLVNLINNTHPDRYRHAIISMTNITDFRSRIRTPGVKCYALGKKPGKDLMVFFRLWKQLRALHPDIVHTRNLSAIEGQVPAFFAGIKHRVQGEHGWDVDDINGNNKKNIWIRRILQIFIHRWIALSLEGRSYLLKKVGVDENRVHHICNGVDIGRFHTQDNARSTFPDGFAPEGTLVFGTVGRSEVVKDQMTLVRAFVELLKIRADNRDLARLVIIGDGTQRKALEQTAKEAGIAELVWFAGFRDDIPQLLPAFDVFVLPSLAEGISNTILEAMASGVPVVATRVGGNLELVSEGVTGHLVPSADPTTLAAVMGRYLDAPGLAKDQGDASRRRAEQEFSLQVMVKKYLAVYDELVNKT